MGIGPRRVVAGVALAVQAVVLFVPRTPEVPIPGQLPLDKVVHFAVFALATWSLLWAGAALVPTLLLMALYAPASEMVQGLFYSQRSGEPADAAADLLGVAAGAAVARWTNRKPADVAGGRP